MHKLKTLSAGLVIAGSASIGAVAGEVISQHAGESYRNVFPPARSLEMQSVASGLKEVGSYSMEFMGVLGGFVLGVASGINTTYRMKILGAMDSYNTGNYSD